MATYESISATNFSTSETNSLTITKPTGLAVGDLMLAVLAKNDVVNETSSSYNTLSGWTSRGSIDNSPADGMQLAIQTKVAEASDVSASNFTFTPTQNCFTGGAILRISNFGRWNSIEFDSSGGTTTISYTATSTPLRPDSLIVTAFFNRDGGGSLTASSYTTTPSITLTERLDQVQDAATEDPHLAIATGNYSGTSQITDYGCTLSSASSDCGCLIIINPVESPTADVSHLAITPAIEGVTGSNNVVSDVSHQALTPTLNGVTTTSSSDGVVWTTINKT